MRQKVIAELSQLIGLPMTAARRAADMRTIQFGILQSVQGGSVGEFALHIQCPWRIEGPDGIITGRSDLWEPRENGPEFDLTNWDYEKSPNLQDSLFEKWLAEGESAPIVIAVKCDDCGGTSITFDKGFALKLFPAGTRGEDWRLFRPNTDAPHFVIHGGKIELDDERA